MLPEVYINQIGSLFNQLSELARDWLPILAVVLGAFLAWRYSTRGRKEDILFKEKYNIFESFRLVLKDIKIDYNNLLREREELILKWMGHPIDEGSTSMGIDESEWETYDRFSKRNNEFSITSKELILDIRIDLMYGEEVKNRMEKVKSLLAESSSHNTSVIISIRSYSVRKDKNFKEDREYLRVTWKESFEKDELISALYDLELAMFYDLDLPVKKKLKYKLSKTRPLAGGGNRKRIRTPDL